MRRPIRAIWLLAPVVLVPLGCKPKAAPPPPPPAVKVATVLQQDVPVYLEAIGEARGNTEIEIRARVTGYLETVDFREGTLVTKGQRLYTIDRAPFEAQVAQAKGQLAEAEAQFARARQDVVRFEPLVAKNAISRQEYETSVALEKAAAAAVDAAKATVEQAQIQLSYTTVTSPADGLIGKTEVYPGTLVGQGSSTLLTRVSRIDPIHVRFSLAEKDYLYFFRRREEQKQLAEGMPDLPIHLVLADGSELPESGRLVFVDRAVEAATGTILLEAAFPNSNFMVRPGQYGRSAPPRTSSGARSWFRSAPCRKCRGSTTSPSSGRTIPSRPAWSSRPSGWARSGSSTPGSSPATGSWSKGCRRSGPGSRWPRRP